MSSSGHSISRLLHHWTDGHPSALERLVPRVQARLRRHARRFLRSERAGHTLQPTALVHEAFLRLLDQRRLRWTNRDHFFAVASLAMRRVLVDAARRRNALRRGAGARRVPLDQAPPLPGLDLDVLALHQALEKLEELDPRQCRIVELRTFGGLPVEAVAELLGVSRSTVEADWRMARVWLRRELLRGATPGDLGQPRRTRP